MFRHSVRITHLLSGEPYFSVHILLLNMSHARSVDWRSSADSINCYKITLLLLQTVSLRQQLWPFVEASSGSASAGLSLGVELSNSTLTPLTAGQLKVVPFTLSFLDSFASLLVNPKAATLGCFHFVIFFITKPELKKYQYEHFKYRAGIATVTIAT